MKNKYMLGFIFLIPVLVLHAQEISYTLTVTDAGCNGTTGGKAAVAVHGTYPPFTFLWSNGSTSSAVNDLVPGDYSVTVTDSTGADTLVAVHIGERQCRVNPETLFTPNGDGHNDTWQIGNIDYFPENLVLVYNRWGQKVYEHRGAYEPWDGRDLLGVPVPDNSYYYIIYEDHADEKSIVKGCVSVIR